MIQYLHAGQHISVCIVKGCGGGEVDEEDKEEETGEEEKYDSKARGAPNVSWQQQQATASNS